MEELLKVLPVILYILGIKLIRTINRANKVLDDVYEKTKSLNGLFHTIDTITDALSNVSDSVVGALSGLFGKIFKKKLKEKEDDIDE